MPTGIGAGNAKELGRHFALIGVLLALTFAASLDHEFVNWDDDYYLHRNSRVKELSLGHVLSLFNPNSIHEGKTFIEFLPLRDLTWAIDFAAWAYNPVGYHLGNVVLHYLTCLALYLLVVVAFSSRRQALLAAMLFAVLPCHVESVAWIACRKDPLFLFLELLSMVFLLQYLDGASRSRLWLSALFLALSLWSKSLALTMPALAVLLLLAARPALPWRRYLALLPHLVVVVIFAHQFLGTGVAKDLVQPDYGGLRALPKGFLAYPPVQILPFPLCQRYDLAIPPGWLQLEVLLPAAILLVLVLLTVKVRLAHFALAWTFVALVPVLNFVPFPILMAERYLYLPSVGPVLFASWWLAKRPPAFSAIIFLVFAGLSASHAEVFQNSITLWSDVLSKYPRLGVAHANLTSALFERGQEREALAAATAGLEVEPDNAMLPLVLGHHHRRAGRYDQALASYERAGHAQQLASKLHAGRGTTFLLQGRLTEAREALLSALSTPSHDHYRADPTTYHNLALVEVRLGHREGFKRAVTGLLETLDFSRPEQVIEAAHLLAATGRATEGLALLERGRTAFSDLRYDEALVLFRNRLGLDPQDQRP